MSKKIVSGLLKNISLTSKKKNEKNTKSNSAGWFKKNLVGISLVLLLLFSLAQTAQLVFIYSTVDYPSGGSVGASATLDSLPDMVGGC